MTRATNVIHARNAIRAAAAAHRRTSWSLPARIVDTLLTWQERAQSRKRLAEMPDYLLRDIGVSRTTAVHEANKPFWKA